MAAFSFFEQTHLEAIFVDSRTRTAKAPGAETLLPRENTTLSAPAFSTAERHTLDVSFPRLDEKSRACFF